MMMSWLIGLVPAMAGAAEDYPFGAIAVVVFLAIVGWVVLQAIRRPGGGR